MKVIVTGGSGFIGRRLVRKLLAETDYEVVNADNLTYAADNDALADLKDHPRYRFRRVDITRDDELESLFDFERPDGGVFHLAAETHVDRSIGDPINFFETNVGGTYHLVQAVRAHLAKNILPEFKFIHVSTDEVYGSLPLEGKEKFHESHPYQPRSPYSASKASSDHIIHAWIHTYGLPGIITHCSNNFGPGQHLEKLIPQTICNFYRGKEVPVYGDGLNVRDWIHVDDHCAALIAVFQRGAVGETYDIGGDNEWHNIDLVNRLADLVGTWLPRFCDTLGAEQRTLIRFVKDRAGHDRRYAIDSTKIKTQLGWQPTSREQFEARLSSTVAWYVANLKEFSNVE